MKFKREKQHADQCQTVTHFFRVELFLEGVLM